MIKDLHEMIKIVNEKADAYFELNNICMKQIDVLEKIIRLDEQRISQIEKCLNNILTVLNQ